MPLDPELQILHTNLLGGDLRAASRIVERVLPTMVRIVRTQVPKLHDGHEDACLEALLDYLQKPADYDPERASLLSYLVGKATFGAMTSVRAQGRRQQHEGQFALAAEVTVGFETRGEEAALEGVQVQEIMAAHGRTLCVDPKDEDVLSLITAGEKAMPAYLAALGLPDTDQGREEAALRRERIRGRLRRLRRHFTPPPK